VALAVVLLVGAGLLARSFVKLGGVQPGFDLGGVLQLSMTAPNDMARERRPAFFDAIERAITSVPGVTSVGASSIAPFSGGNTNTQFLVDGRGDKPDDYFPADWRSVTPGFFNTLGVSLVRGRLLETTDVAGHPHVAVIDQLMAARLFPGQEPLGAHLVPAQSARGPGDRIEIVGIVRDIRDQSLATDPAPAIYFPEEQKPWIQLTFFVRGRGRTTSASLVDGIRRAVREAAPSMPIPDITPLATNVDIALAPQRFTTSLLGGFATIALLLAVIGIYGVVSFNVAQRAPELGVRLAFGATPGRLARGVLRDSVLLVVVGAVAGCVGAAILARLITSLLFATDTWDAPTYAAVVGTLLAVAAAASYIPARRAARTDPAIVMREL
jgi:predicted permease